MIMTIKNYLLSILLKTIIRYILFLLFLIFVFINPTIIIDQINTFKSVTGITDNIFVKIIFCVPLIFSLFKFEIYYTAKGK